MKNINCSQHGVRQIAGVKVENPALFMRDNRTSMLYAEEKNRVVAFLSDDKIEEGDTISMYSNDAQRFVERFRIAKVNHC